MKKVKDIFSKQAGSYKKFRPLYPAELYGFILQHVKSRNECWDCGTGNGQVAVELSKHFKKVYATDISSSQLTNALQKRNITYSINRAEKTPFLDNQFDLITVGQAVHWFDMDAFNLEARRVLKEDGIISIWGYGLVRIDDPVNKLFDYFYSDVVGPYWDVERSHVDSHYTSIKFDFDEITCPENLSILVNWNLGEFEGYLNSWSSVQHYITGNRGVNPVDELIKKVVEYWEPQSIKELRFPIFMRMGRK